MRTTKIRRAGRITQPQPQSAAKTPSPQRKRKGKEATTSHTESSPYTLPPRLAPIRGDIAYTILKLRKGEGRRASAKKHGAL